MNVGIDFYVAQFITENTAQKKKIITHLTSPFLSTLETYFVFYLRCELFSPFQCLIPFCSSQSTQYRADTQEIADEEMR